MKSLISHILSINGSDSTGTSGIESDIRTIQALGGYAQTVITSITVQTSQGIQQVSTLPAHLVVGQVRAIYADSRPLAIKIGMVDDAEAIGLIRDEIVGCRSIVCSPVVLSSDGTRLMSDDALCAYRRLLIPNSQLLILKCHDAEIILNTHIQTDSDMLLAAQRFQQEGAQWVMLRGSRHADGRVTALLYGHDYARFFSSYNVEGWQRHGIAGVLSTAVATRLSMGDTVPEAVSVAHEYLHNQIVYSVPTEGYGVRPQEIYNRYLSLIVEHHCMHHDVGYYADALAITTRYLSQVTRIVVDKSPKQVIDEYLIEKSRNLLQNTVMSIQEISTQLGFSTAVHFARFVGQHEGKTPRMIRQGRR